MENVFEFEDYRKYLLDYLKNSSKKGRGLRSQWAKVSGCQIAFISHVLSGTNDLSLEQAEAISRFMAHNKEETEYFLLLLQKARSGTAHLKSFFTQMLNEKLTAREDLRSRMKIKETLNIEDQAIYYSKWYFTAVHMILTIPEYQNIHAIADYFRLPLSVIKECIDFLESREFIALENGKYKVKGAFLHISRTSPMYFHQQAFWRQKAIESVYKNSDSELHFASCFSVAEKDLKKIRDILSQSIEASTEVIKPSKEEKLYSICMDLFEVR